MSKKTEITIAVAIYSIASILFILAIPVMQPMIIGFYPTGYTGFDVVIMPDLVVWLIIVIVWWIGFGNDIAALLKSFMKEYYIYLKALVHLHLSLFAFVGVIYLLNLIINNIPELSLNTDFISGAGFATAFFLAYGLYRVSLNIMNIFARNEA